MFPKKRVVTIVRRNLLIGGVAAMLVAVFLGAGLWAIAEDNDASDTQEMTSSCETTPVLPDPPCETTLVLPNSLREKAAVSLRSLRTATLVSLKSLRKKQPASTEPPSEPTPVLPKLAGETTPISPAPKSSQAKDQKREMVTERYSNRALKIERQVTVDDQFNYVNDGIYKEYERNGSLLKAGEYRLGKREGRWVQYFQSDEGGLFSGKVSSEFPGPFVSEASFVDGKLHGKWTITAATGRKVIEWQFEGGKRHGRACWWHCNGQKRREGRYEQGLPVGAFCENDSNGKLVRSVTYIDGRPLTKKIHWHSKDQKAYEGSVLPGRDLPELAFDWSNTTVTGDLSNRSRPEQKHGSWVSWYRNGQPKIEAQYCEGVPVGKFAWWYENGQKEAEGSYEDGLRTGTWITWHPNGMKESFGEHAAGASIGRWAQWDANGKLVESHDFGREPQRNARAKGEDTVKATSHFDSLERTARSSMVSTTD